MLTFRPCAVDEEPAATLVQAMRDEIAVLYETSTDRICRRAVRLSCARRTGRSSSATRMTRPVCCGGVKRLSGDACEIKKMFVTADARGRGSARELLVELERRARELGFSIVRLDTGPRQPRAQRMYERAGYVAIENFNANPVATFFAEKRLV
jgi:GNAT superfamily N-acetyltransferase